MSAAREAPPIPHRRRPIQEEEETEKYVKEDEDDDDDDGVSEAVRQEVGKASGGQENRRNIAWSVSPALMTGKRNRRSTLLHSGVRSAKSGSKSDT